MLVLPRFRWPGFENKSGPKVKKSGPKYFSVRTNSSIAQIKVGQTHFQISISGPKRKGYVAYFSLRANHNTVANSVKNAKTHTTKTMLIVVIIITLLIIEYALIAY